MCWKSPFVLKGSQLYLITTHMLQLLFTFLRGHFPKSSSMFAYSADIDGNQSHNLIVFLNGHKSLGSMPDQAHTSK